MYDILVILVDFCGNFPWFWLFFATRIRICFIEADPDPYLADRNETDPDPKHCFSHKLKIEMNCFIEVKLSDLIDVKPFYLEMTKENQYELQKE